VPYARGLSDFAFETRGARLFEALGASPIRRRRVFLRRARIFAAPAVRVPERAPKTEPLSIRNARIEPILTRRGGRLAAIAGLLCRHAFCFRYEQGFKSFIAEMIRILDGVKTEPKLNARNGATPPG
jgi:hypothetical protein